METTAPKTLGDLENPIADAQTMVGIIAELLEAALGDVRPEKLLHGTYHTMTLAQGDRILWATYDALSRLEKIRADWDALMEAGQ